MIATLKGRLLAAYLHRLLNDPLAETKIALFKSDKWKKQYQAAGQNLIRVNFLSFRGGLGGAVSSFFQLRVIKMLCFYNPDAV